MREKKVTDKTINKYINFLLAIKAHKTSQTIEEIVAEHTINKSIVNPLQKLGIIERKGKTSWKWLKGEPDKQMVLSLLDFVLHSTKPQQPAILPAYITQITDLLKEISAKLTIPQTIEESSADGVKTSDRVFLAGHIASGLYKDLKICNHEWVSVQEFNDGRFTNTTAKAQCRKCGCEPNPTQENTFEAINDLIVLATSDLLTKLNSK